MLNSLKQETGDIPPLQPTFAELVFGCAPDETEIGLNSLKLPSNSDSRRDYQDTDDTLNRKKKSISEKIAKLKVLTDIVELSAHPDDEAMPASGLSIRRVYNHICLSLTSGDNGRIDNEQFHLRPIEKAIIRYLESMYAGLIDFSDRLFGPFSDFGYTHSLIKTLKTWGGDKESPQNLGLEDCRRLLKAVAPDILLLRFPSSAYSKGKVDPGGDHGQHYATTVLGQLASLGCETIKELVHVHLPASMYGTIQYVESLSKDESLNCCVINVDTHPLFTGINSRDVQQGSKRTHASQISGEYPAVDQYILEFPHATQAQRNNKCNAHLAYDEESGNFIVKVLQGKKDLDPFDSSKVTWNDVSSTIDIEKNIQSIEAAYESSVDENALLEDLFSLRNTLKELKETILSENTKARSSRYLHKIDRKIGEIDEIIKECLFDSIQVSSDGKFSYVPGESLTIDINYSSPISANIKDIRLIKGDVEYPCQNSTICGEEGRMQAKFSIPDDAEIDVFTLPTLTDPKINPLYPFGTPPLHCEFTVQYNGEEVTYSLPVISHDDKGNKNDVVIVPPVTLEIGYLKGGVFKPCENHLVRENHVKIAVRATAHRKISQGEIQLTLPEGWITPDRADLLELNPGETEIFEFSVNASSPPQDDFEGSFSASVKVGKRTYSHQHRAFDATRKSLINFEPACGRIVHCSDLSPSTGKTIGYLQLVEEDPMLEAIQALGYKVKLLTEDSFSQVAFEKLDGIILPSYTFNSKKADWVNKDAVSTAINSYVENGGRLILNPYVPRGALEYHAETTPIKIHHLPLTTTKFEITGAELELSFDGQQNTYWLQKLLMSPLPPFGPLGRNLPDGSSQDFIPLVTATQIYNNDADDEKKARKLIGRMAFEKGFVSYLGITLEDFFILSPKGVLPTAYKALDEVLTALL